MRHLPIFLDLRDRPVLIVGDGPVADTKANLAGSAGASVRRAPRFDPALLRGCAAAFAADAPEPDLRALADAARAAGIPVNVADRPELCSFIMPSIVDRDPLTVAVSTGGAAPVLARVVRSKIEALLPPTLGRIAALLDEVKSALRQARPEIAGRRRLIERWLAGAPAELALAGREDEARTLMAQDMAEDGTRDAAVDGDDASASAGMVFLVGAGPGAADLATLRAQRLLGEADVIVHDRLVTHEVLDLARRDATRIFVGKARAKHCMRQDEINALLVRLAREGKRVVRLKGGDPFVFGRGGEEAAALAEAGVPFEIVPGVTAALACAAQAQIPLTHRAVARSVTFVTGHTLDGTVDVDFPALVRLGGTVAFYMGLVSLPLISAGLIAAGMPAGMPAALIERGGTERQRTLQGTIETLADQADGWAESGPVLLLIGEAVSHATGGLARRPSSVDRERRAGDRAGLVRA